MIRGLCLELLLYCIVMDWIGGILETRKPDQGIRHRIGGSECIHALYISAEYREFYLRRNGMHVAWTDSCLEELENV